VTSATARMSVRRRPATRSVWLSPLMVRMARSCSDVVKVVLGAALQHRRELLVGRGD
jgi:hypothetical protein